MVASGTIAVTAACHAQGSIDASEASVVGGISSVVGSLSRSSATMRAAFALKVAWLAICPHCAPKDAVDHPAPSTSLVEPSVESTP